MSMAKGSVKRRQYYINKKFQTGFILKFILVLVLGGVLSVVITLLTTNSTLTSSYDGARLVIEKTSFAILPSVVITSLITTSVVGIVAVVVTLLVSHRLAGPMYRFEKDIEEIGAGNLQKKIRIRDGDQFVEVAENLNRMVDNLNRQMREIRDEIDRTVEQAEDSDVSEELLETLRSCRESIDSRFVL